MDEAISPPFNSMELYIKKLLRGMNPNHPDSEKFIAEWYGYPLPYQETVNDEWDRKLKEEDDLFFRDAILNIIFTQIKRRYFDEINENLLSQKTKDG